MAVDNTEKKKAFVKACMDNAVLFAQVRAAAAALREKRASDAVLAGLADGDANVFTGPYAHLTTAILVNYLDGVAIDLEKMVTNQAVATVNRLPLLLAIQPN